MILSFAKPEPDAVSLLFCPDFQPRKQQNALLTIKAMLLSLLKAGIFVVD
jgi:hypothetical protein